MKYLLDTANVEFIKKMLDVYEIQGITTNPSIIAKEKKDYTKLLKELRQVLKDKDFHIQLTSLDYEGMIEEAHLIKQLVGDPVFIKIPVSNAGYQAIKELTKQGFSCTATAVVSFQQGLMAAACGAKYIAFYVNRTSNSGIDGNQIIKQLYEILQRDHSESIILGASYKSISQINDSILAGCRAVTVPNDLFEVITYNEITTKSIDKFDADITNIYHKSGIDLFKTED